MYLISPNFNRVIYLNRHSRRTWLSNPIRQKTIDAIIYACPCIIPASIEIPRGSFANAVNPRLANATFNFICRLANPLSHSHQPPRSKQLLSPPMNCHYLITFAIFQTLNTEGKVGSLSSPSINRCMGEKHMEFTCWNVEILSLKYHRLLLSTIFFVVLMFQN